VGTGVKVGSGVLVGGGVLVGVVVGGGGVGLPQAVLILKIAARASRRPHRARRFDLFCIIIYIIRRYFSTPVNFTPCMKKRWAEKKSKTGTIKPNSELACTMCGLAK
jgi:hypothetical protein